MLYNQLHLIQLKAWADWSDRMGCELQAAGDNGLNWVKKAYETT